MERGFYFNRSCKIALYLTCLGEKMIQARTLSGFRDRLPQEAFLKAELLQTITGVFESFGFVPIETPHLEYADVLSQQGGDEIGKQLYAFKDHGGRDVALRFDLTVPLARFITQHRHCLTLPFKRYAVGNVFRGERAQKGRYREFTQCDFDFIGSKSIASDSEILQIIDEIMRRLEVGSFKILINHRGILNGICEHLGIQRVDETLRIIDKLEKIGKEGVKGELQSILMLSEEKIDSLLEFVSIRQEGGFGEFFSSIAYLKDFNPTLQSAIEDLEELGKILECVGVDSAQINFSIARGLGYYTGIIYETILEGMPSIGSVCSGGRYDFLTQAFSKEALSGVGASVGLDRLMVALEEILKLHSPKTKAQILCIAMQKEHMPLVQKIAQTLRSQFIPSEVYPDLAKLSKVLSYANSKQFAFVAIVGENEAKEGRITLKDLQSGEQTTQDLKEIVEILRSKCIDRKMLRAMEK